MNNKCFSFIGGYSKLSPFNKHWLLILRRAAGILVVMDDVQKLFRIIVNGQSALKGELLIKLSGVEKKVEEHIKKLRSEVVELRKETKDGFVKVNKRLDLQGKQLAFLEDDAPTKEEFDELEQRVSNLEDRTASV